MGSIQINQTSAFAPAVCSHRGQLHMVFVANNDSRELLHVASQDGINWSRKLNVRQSTKAAPALSSFGNTLRVLFIANNNTNTLLECVYDDADDNWSDNHPIVGQSSKTAPALAQMNGLFMYFVANNDSNDLLALNISL